MSPNRNEGIHLTALMQTLLDTVISMLLIRLGGACAWLWKSYRKVETRDKATEAGLSPPACGAQEVPPPVLRPA